MRIAQVAPLWIPIPPITYGGSEFIISNLTEDLVMRGHDVVLYASGDSRTSALLIPMWEKSLWRARLETPHAVIAAQMGRVVEDQSQFDIIHNHSDFYFAPFAKWVEKPVVSTIHRPLDEATRKLFRKYEKWHHYVAISYDQMNSAPELKFSRVIYNGIPVERYPYNETPQDYLLWLSKIEPEKGVLEAIEIAKKANEKLILAGNIVAEESGRFFQYEVLPHLDGDQIEYVGQVNFERKVELLKNAKAVLYPIMRREPFGIVIIEAMACGTPVIGFHRGSVPEIIANGRTGFVVESADEMVAAIKHIHEIRRQDCRALVEQYFTSKQMTNAYEALYKELLT